MNTIKIPEGWYELKQPGTRRGGDQFTFSGAEAWYYLPESAGEHPMWPNMRYIRKHTSLSRFVEAMDNGRARQNKVMDEVLAESAKVLAKANALFKTLEAEQNPATAQETPSTGILAAAQEIETLANERGLLEGCDDQTCFMFRVKAIISRHCVDKPDWDELMEGPFARAVIERELATEKARADKLQDELFESDRQSEEFQSKLADERDKLQAELVEAKQDYDRLMELAFRMI